MLCIHLGSITEEGLEINEAVEAAALPLLDDLARKDEIRFVRPVQVRLRASFAGESVRIDGRVASFVRLACSRCLARFNMQITADFSATAVPELPAHMADETKEEVELAAHEMEVIAYSGTSIDLRDEIAQQLIMALPFTPRCSLACRGMCSRCGANLNIASCQCTGEDGGNPFAVLKNLELPSREE